jgi:hypothetical protein
MARYLLTVPVKFGRADEVHPLGAGPEDLIAIEADSHDEAAGRLFDAFGRNDTWCSVYGPGELSDIDRNGYYPGRIIELGP